MHELAHEFTSRKISPWGGIKFFHKTYLTSGIKSHLETLPLPLPGSNRGYSSVDLIEGFLVSVVLGSRRLEHTGLLNTDEVIKEIFGWKKGMASSSTFSRFFRKFDLNLNKEIFPSLMRYFFSNVAAKHLTIDIDSTVITRYGHQENVAKGYNPHRRGHGSHQPLLAFCDELKMVVNAKLRPGNTNSHSDALEFLQEVFKIVNPERISLLRGDVGFYNDKIIQNLEDLNINYLFRARMSARLISQIPQVEQWYANNDVVMGAAYGEINYKADTWKKPRRIVLVRLPRKENDKTARSRKLFEEYEQFDDYEFHAFVTNTNWSEVDIHRRYNQRGDCENRIKDLKYDYGIDGFSLKTFAAAETAFRFIMVAYNLMQLFRQFIMLAKKNHRLSSIKFQCIAIGSYLTRSGRKLTMKLAAEGKRRHFLEHIFKNLGVVRPPYC